MSNVVSTWLACFAAAGLALAAAQAEDGIVIPAGSVKLVADFELPEGRGPFPAVVIIAGTGPQHRNAFHELTAALNARGIAVLSYDKRGCGQSTGDLSTATLGELTDDATAVTAYLKTRRDVGWKRIGLIGMSQGGLMASAIAAKNPAVAAVVLLGTPFAAYASLAQFSDAVTYNPVSLLREVTVPVLALTGSLDLQAPASENLPVVRAALSGNRDVTVTELPRLNHIFQVAKNGTMEEWNQLNQSAYGNPSMLRIVGDWLARRLRRT